MPVYELINPSDPYTFEADDINIAACAVVLLSPHYGARRVLDNIAEQTPIMFGWVEWFEGRGIFDLNNFLTENRLKIATSLESFLIGNASVRADVISMMNFLPDEKRQQWRDERQDRNRTSLSQIGERAQAIAKHLRVIDREKGEPATESRR